MSSTIITKSPQTNGYWFTDLLFMTVFISIFYFIWIGAYPLFTPDEGRYSEVAREMVMSGDYITPRLNGVVFLDKPVLYYWLQASAIKIFGLKEWALRIWPAIIGILGCCATYITGRILFSRRAGILSSLILATCPLYYGASHYANLDLELAVLVSISLFSSILGIQTQQTRFWIIAYVFSALAFLTKGLIGFIFPTMIIGAWILLLNRWNLLKKMHLLTGLVIFVLITSPWYILAQKANSQFLHFFFIDQQVLRFLTKGDFNNKTAMWFYIPIVLTGIFPWSSFIIQAVGQKINSIWKNKAEQQINLFLLLWFFLIFSFFTIPKSKTVGYILPIFPVAALMIGSYLDKESSCQKSYGLIFGFILYIASSLMFATFFLIAPKIAILEVTPNLIPYLNAAAVIFILSSLLMTYFLFKKKSFDTLFKTLFVTTMAFLFVVIGSTSAINQKSVKPLTTEIKPYLHPQDEVVTFFKYYQDLPIYLERRISIVADWKAADIPQYDNWVRELWYGMPFQDTSQWLIDEETFWKKWNSQKRLFVFLNENYFDNFKSKTTQRKAYKIAQSYNMILVSNFDVTTQPPPRKN